MAARHPQTFGAERLIEELRALGSAAEEWTAGGGRFAFLPEFGVSYGRFVDRGIGLGIPAPPDFP